MEIHALTDGNDFVLSCNFLISKNNLLVHKDGRHQAWNTDKKILVHELVPVLLPCGVKIDGKLVQLTWQTSEHQKGGFKGTNVSLFSTPQLV